MTLDAIKSVQLRKQLTVLPQVNPEISEINRRLLSANKKATSLSLCDRKIN